MGLVLQARNAAMLTALASLSFAKSATPSAPAAAGYEESSRKIVLGHHACVLPRLLTLLAGFGPEARFVKASKDYFVGEPLFPERRHDKP